MTDTLICAPVFDSAHDRPVIGSVVEVCAECERQVWIAPSGQAILAEKALRVLCVPCAKDAILADPEPVIAPLTDEQKQELRRAMSDDA